MSEAVGAVLPIRAGGNTCSGLGARERGRDGPGRDGAAVSCGLRIAGFLYRRRSIYRPNRAAGA